MLYSNVFIKSSFQLKWRLRGASLNCPIPCFFNRFSNGWGKWTNSCGRRFYLDAKIKKKTAWVTLYSIQDAHFLIESSIDKWFFLFPWVGPLLGQISCIRCMVLDLSGYPSFPMMPKRNFPSPFFLSRQFVRTSVFMNWRQSFLSWKLSVRVPILCQVPITHDPLHGMLISIACL